jgi:serine protease Do
MHRLMPASNLFSIRALRPLAIAGVLALTVLPTQARGPEGIADVAERVISAVVNISTSQAVKGRGGDSDNSEATPRVPEGSPFSEFFDEFFKNNPGRRGDPKGAPARRVNSLGSGFIIDASGIVVTNNHVIADADEVTVVLNDGTKLKAEVVGRDKKVDLAVLRVKSDKPLPFVKFGESDKLRLGEWVIAIGNPFGLGGTVTSGIVSARNRDINSGPYDNYIQTDAAINRGNSGGPLFNLDGDVIGVNTAIISPSGTSVGIAFAVPSKTVTAIVDQLQKFGETQRGWLGVRIQQVTDDVAATLSISPPRGALIADIDEKGPAKPAGIEVGDVVVKFDGKDIKDMRDLPRIVADTTVGKEVDVIIIRKGKEETRKVTLLRLEEDDKPVKAAAKVETPVPQDKPVVQKALGLDLAALTRDLRTRFKIKDSVKGVVVVSVEANSDAAEKRLSAGDVIVEVAQEAVTNTQDIAARIDALKKDGKKSALLLVSNANGELRFVALNL